MNEKGKETSNFFMIIKFVELEPFLGKIFSPFSLDLKLYKILSFFILLDIIIIIF